MTAADAGFTPVVKIRILRNVADLVRTEDLQLLTHRGVREWLQTHLGLEAGTHYSKAWLKTEVDLLLSERRRAPQQGRSTPARTPAAARRGHREADAAEEEERELRRLEGGMPSAGGGSSSVPPAGGGGGGKDQDQDGVPPPFTSADVDSVLAFYADPKAPAGRKRRKPQQPAGRAKGLDHLVSLALAALAEGSDGRQGSRAAQVCAEVRRRFPQICASFMQGGSGRVNASWRAQVEEVLRTRKDLFARKMRPGAPGASRAAPAPATARTVLYRLRRRPAAAAPV